MYFYSTQPASFRNVRDLQMVEILQQQQQPEWRKTVVFDLDVEAPGNTNCTTNPPQQQEGECFFADATFFW